MEPEIITELSAAAEGNFNDLSALLRRAIAAYRAIATERDHIQRGFNAAVQTVEVRDARINTLEAALRKVETFMMIVEPRSHKAEYINMLASVRSVLPPYALERLGVK